MRKDSNAARRFVFCDERVRAIGQACIAHVLIMLIVVGRRIGLLSFSLLQDEWEKGAKVPAAV